MGSGKFDESSYASFSASTAGKTTEQVFKSSDMHSTLDPKGVKIRESRDSKDNPHSTPIIIAVDVTGSMGMLADVIARTGLGVLFANIIKTKPVTDPHVMFMAVGDMNCDDAPLQVSQFEADNRIVDQLVNIYIEKGGGNNGFESYNGPWFFAARHTEIDSMIKRGKRGYLFTVGDEEAPGAITKKQIKKFIGDDLQSDVETDTILAEVQRKYDVFHIIIKEGNHCRNYFKEVKESWTNLLGQHAIVLEDHTKLTETIVGIIEVVEGRDVAVVGKDYGAVVHEAVKHLPRSRTPRLALADKE